MPPECWDSVLNDPSAGARPSGGIPLQQRRLSEIPRHVLRVHCRRCDRTVEIQKTDAVRLYGEHAIWKDVGNRLACEAIVDIDLGVRELGDAMIRRSARPTAPRPRTIGA